MFFFSLCFVVMFLMVSLVLSLSFYLFIYLCSKLSMRCCPVLDVYNIFNFGEIHIYFSLNCFAIIRGTFGTHFCLFKLDITFMYSLEKNFSYDKEEKKKITKHTQFVFSFR